MGLLGAVDEKASLQEQAYEAAELGKSLTIAVRNAMQDANAAAQLNFTLPPRTYEQLKNKFAPDYSGDDLYKKIIEEAEAQLKTNGCFVAGTLVHTKEGLRPIELIKVGDFVLSEPESGVGDASYKRVTKTFEYDDREVYYVKCIVNPEVLDARKYEYEHIVVTGGHPFCKHQGSESHCFQSIPLTGFCRK